MSKIVFMHIIVIRLYTSFNEILYYSGERTKWFTGMVGHINSIYINFFIPRVVLLLESKLFLFCLFFIDVFADVSACCFYCFYLVIMVLLSVKSAVGLPPLQTHLPLYLFKYISFTVSVWAIEHFPMSTHHFMTQQFKIGHYSNSACI